MYAAFLHPTHWILWRQWAWVLCQHGCWLPDGVRRPRLVHLFARNIACKVLSVGAQTFVCQFFRSDLMTWLRMSLDYTAEMHPWCEVLEVLPGGLRLQVLLWSVEARRWAFFFFFFFRFWFMFKKWWCSWMYEYFFRSDSIRFDGRKFSPASSLGEPLCWVSWMHFSNPECLSDPWTWDPHNGALGSKVFGDG